MNDWLKFHKTPNYLKLALTADNILPMESFVTFIK